MVLTWCKYELCVSYFLESPLRLHWSPWSYQSLLTGVRTFQFRYFNSTGESHNKLYGLLQNSKTSAYPLANLWTSVSADQQNRWWPHNLLETFCNLFCHPFLANILCYPDFFNYLCIVKFVFVKSYHRYPTAEILIYTVAIVKIELHQMLIYLSILVITFLICTLSYVNWLLLMIWKCVLLLYSIFCTNP